LAWYGRGIFKHRDVVLRAYGPLLNDAPKAGVTVTRDIAYGPHPRQILDLFAPEDMTNAPVVVFVHGGVFVRGDKGLSSEVYDNVLYWFATGFIGINIEYRLAPQSQWPGGADDLGLAIAWACAKVALHGGDPSSIFAIGHSAGSTHPAAGYLGRGLTGVVLLSPRLRIDVSSENPFADNVR
jgi:acetyl esterase